MKKLPTPEYSQGICQDGAAILKDGEPLTPEQIIKELRNGHQAQQLALDYSSIIHDMVVANQAAWIEWDRGGGAEAAMAWIYNGLWGPGHVPDESAPWSDNAQHWYSANKHNPFPFCECGNPSSIAGQGIFACCEEHFQQAKAKADSGTC